MEYTLITFFIIGALGALTKDIVEDGELTLPKISNEKFTVGFIGGMITGGVAGYLIDQSPTMAFFSGYSGTSIIENLLNKTKEKIKPEDNCNEAIIRKIAKEENVSPDLAVRVAKCESNLDEKAVHVNKDGSKDRGLFQINDKWHPEVSDEEAYNPIFATKFFCKAFKNGKLSWWKATKTCWDK